MKLTEYSVSFDGMCWPRPSAALSDLNWKLRYGGTLTNSERLIAASVLSAYTQMVHDPAKKRNKVISKIRKSNCEGK